MGQLAGDLRSQQWRHEPLSCLDGFSLPGLFPATRRHDSFRTHADYHFGATVLAVSRIPVDMRHLNTIRIQVSASQIRNGSNIISLVVEALAGTR